MIIREYKKDDCKKLIELFYETVHGIDESNYSQKQLDAWAPEQIDEANWKPFLEAIYVVVVEIDNVIVGFGDIDSTGYLNMLYVHKDYQRKGIATAIEKEIERYAIANNILLINTDASIIAKPFFESKGYKVKYPQNKTHNGEIFTNYIMEKTLSSQ